MSEKKFPLTIYVLWQPEFEEGYSYAEYIYTHFTRDIKNPASRGIGIPVLFSPREKMYEHKLQINFESSERIAFIVFIDDKMMLDNNWYSYISQIQERCDKDPRYIIYPIAIKKTAFSFPVQAIKSKNYIRLFEKEDKVEKYKYLIFTLTHELCRFLYNIERISEVEDYTSPPPIKLFLSHAKADGLKITKSIWRYIKLDTPLDDFFDAQDIAPGYDFANEIKSAIPNCMILVIHTDEYSSREWCRKEIILAKEYSIPILVLDCLNKLEKRSFPYMANVQTLRIKEHNEPDYDDIICTALIEVLRHKFQLLYNSYIIESYRLKISNKNVLGYPPELITLVQRIDPICNLVVYPDPPLGNDEIAILKKYNKELNFVTPTLLFCVDNKTMTINESTLNGYKIGISISEIFEENIHGLNILHLQDIMIEIARYLLIAGAKLAYGGDIRYDKNFNFVDILTCLVKNHNTEHEEIPQRVENYVSNYLRHFVSEEIQSELIDVAKFIFMEPIHGIDYENSNDVNYLRYVKARDLSNMRLHMNNQINARIILGGKKENYQGVYPGVLEEVILAMNANNPIYLIGAFGGIAQEIIKCLLGNDSDILSFEYQSKFNDYGTFYNYYNKKAIEDGVQQVDYLSIKDYLKNKGILGLKNGLNEIENETLFKSTNTLEIVSLIIKGLSKI